MTRSRWLNEWTSDDLALAVARRHDDPRTALAAIAEQRRRLERHEAEAVLTMIEHGRSWAEIGLAAGITRQAAHQKWGTGRAGLLANPVAVPQVYLNP